MGTERKVNVGPGTWSGQDPLVLAMVATKNQRPQGHKHCTSAVSLPNFIVIKVPETVPAPHTSMALSLPVPECLSPQSSKYSGFSGKKKPRTSVNVPSQGLELAPEGAVRDQDGGFPARQR